MDIQETINSVKNEVEDKLKNVDVNKVAEKAKEEGIKGAAGEVLGSITGKSDKK